MKKLILISALTLFGCSSPVEKVTNGKSCTDCDLRGADLSGLTLSNIDLSNSDLSNANLSNTVFKNVNFANANLNNANLTNIKSTYFDEESSGSGKIIIHRDPLQNKIQTSFIKADLSGANLSEASFIHTYFQEANLTNANLTGASFEGSFMKGTNLTNANLTRASFDNRMEMHTVNLTNANLAGVSFKGLMKGFADNLDNLDFTDANLNGASFEDTSLTDANFTDANLNGASFEDTSLTDANFTDANLLNARFESNDMNGVDFTNAELANASFESNDMNDVNFTNASIGNTHFNFHDRYKRNTLTEVIIQKIDNKKSLFVELSRKFLKLNNRDKKNNNLREEMGINEEGIMEHIIEGRSVPDKTQVFDIAKRSNKFISGDEIEEIFDSWDFNPREIEFFFRRGKDQDVDEYDLSEDEKKLFLLLYDHYNNYPYNIYGVPHGRSPEESSPLEELLGDLYEQSILDSGVGLCVFPGRLSGNYARIRLPESRELNNASSSLALIAIDQSLAKFEKQLDAYEVCLNNAYEKFIPALHIYTDATVRITYALNFPLHKEKLAAKAREKQREEATEEYQKNLYSLVSQLYDTDEMIDADPMTKEMAYGVAMEKRGISFALAGGFTPEELSRLFANKKIRFQNNMNGCLSAGWYDERSSSTRTFILNSFREFIDLERVAAENPDAKYEEVFETLREDFARKIQASLNRCAMGAIEQYMVN